MPEPIEILEEHSANHPDDVIEVARMMLEEWEGWEYGVAPRSGVATAVWVSYAYRADKGKSQSEVVEEFDSSKAAIHEHADEFWDILQELERS